MLKTITKNYRDREREAIYTLHSELFLKDESTKGKIRGVTSPTQSSKTQWMVAQALLALNERRNAVIVPRNFTGDPLIHDFTGVSALDRDEKLLDQFGTAVRDGSDLF